MRDWKLMKREASLSQNHLSWPFIPSKINLPLMCPYYCTDFNLLQPIKASPPGDTIHSHCVVFHLNSKQWLIKVAFFLLFKDFEGTNELYWRTLKEFCTQEQMDPTQTNWKSSWSLEKSFLFVCLFSNALVHFLGGRIASCIKAWHFISFMNMNAKYTCGSQKKLLFFFFFFFCAES